MWMKMKMTLMEGSRQQGRCLCKKNCPICSYSLPHQVAGRMAPEKCNWNDSRTHKTGPLSCIWHFFLALAILKIVIAMTNMEGTNRYGQEWKTMDVIDQHVCRSRGEAAMSLELFRTIYAVLRFHTCDKLAAIRDVWDKCAEQLPLMYNSDLRSL